MKVKIYYVRIRGQRRRRVPDVRISPRNKLLKIQFRRAHIPRRHRIHGSCIFAFQRFKQIGKQRKFLRFQLRTISRFVYPLFRIGFHDEIVDKLYHIVACARKHDPEKRFEHFQVRIERDLRVCGRAVLREDLINMEGIDSSLFRIPHIQNIPFQITRQSQVFRFRITDNDAGAVRPFVQNQVFQKERLPGTRFPDYHRIAVLIQIPAFPKIKNKRIAIVSVLAEQYSALLHHENPYKRKHRSQTRTVDAAFRIFEPALRRNCRRAKSVYLLSIQHGRAEILRPDRPPDGFFIAAFFQIVIRRNRQRHVQKALVFRLQTVQQLVHRFPVYFRAV